MSVDKFMADRGIVKEFSTRARDDQENAPALPFIDVRGWDEIPVPERSWQTPGRIPKRCVTGFGGNGGTGKSTILLDLAVATVSGQDWLGARPAVGPAIVVCCEDSADEIHRRLDPILAHRNLSFSQIGEDLHVLSLVGQETLFATVNRDGTIRTTSLYSQILEAVKDIKPSLLVLDNSADIFGGNENDRAQVRQFVTLLTRIAQEGDCGLVLTYHPSLTGMTTGSGMSGSTGWSNSFRSRMYLRAPDKKGDEDPDPDERILEVLKANYGPQGETITIRWENGVFVPADGANWIDRRASANLASEVFLTLLAKFTEQERNVSHLPTSPTYAPALFSNEPEAKQKGIKKAAFAAAIPALFDQKKIRIETYGRPSRPYQKLAIVGGKWPCATPVQLSVQLACSPVQLAWRPPPYIPP